MIFVTAPLVAQAACRNPNQDVTVVRPAVPVYPESARKLGLGFVSAKIIVTVGPTGSLLGARIAQSTSNMALDQAALKTARESIYSPKVVNCQPVTSDYLFLVTFDPRASPAPATRTELLPALPGATTGTNAEQTCQMGAMSASQQFQILEQRRDYERALKAASEAARLQMDCAAQFKTSPEKFTLEMLAGSTFSRAADLAFNLNRYQAARDFATRANGIYSDVLAPTIEQNYGRFLTPNATANAQANDDLLKRIAQLAQCSGGVFAPISSLVLSQMPSGSSVHSVGVAGNYAVAIAFGPGGYAVRSFLLANKNGWKVRASEGGAFDLAAYRRNGVPASIAAKLASSVAC